MMHMCTKIDRSNTMKSNQIVEIPRRQNHTSSCPLTKTKALQQSNSKVNTMNKSNI